MRILHLLHQYLPEHVGGSELYTKWLTEALSKRGHNISVFHRRSVKGSGLESRTEEGVQIWAAWNGVFTPTRRFLATFDDSRLEDAFEQVLEQTQAELVHIEHLMGQPAVITKILRKRGIPYVITLWDFWWMCANAQLLTNYSQQICPGPHWYLNCARCALARSDRLYLWPVLPVFAVPLARRNYVLRQVMTGASKLIAPTKFVYNWYAAHNAPIETLVSLSPGLEKPYHPVSRQIKRSGVPIRFAYLGGISRQKGVHIVIEAFNELEKKAELWIAGDETADPAYASRLRCLASANVRFLGKLTREGVWDTLARVDVLVVPSMWYETFAFVISEAFAAGVPVIASKLGPLADRVQHNVDGLLTPSGDAVAMRQTLQRFLDEPDLLSKLQQGIQPIQSIEDHAVEMETVYKSVLGD